jgi:hypothetical protein
MGSTSGATKRVGRSSGRRQGGWRRAALALLALGAAVSPAVSGGCVGGFDAPSEINGLRVLAVTIDGSSSPEQPEGGAPLSKSYANPGDEVTFSMTYYDGLGSAEEGQRPVQITWIGGCFDPVGDQYFACFSQIAERLGSGSAPDPAYFAQGPNLTEFKLKIPEDIVSQRPRPESGPYYGLAYVFFAACAGQLRPVDDQGTGKAGSFPFGCFDSDGRRLGADSFVPGYTQVYVFDDGRTNANPAINALLKDGEPMSENFDAIPKVPPCPITDDERRASGCGTQDPFADCTPVEIKVDVDPGVAEIDPDAKQKELTEVVWVNYYSDQGDFSPGIKLVNDAVQGYNDDHAVKWIPPAEPGVASIWAVVRDARGGASIIQRFIRVERP